MTKRDEYFAKIDEQYQKSRSLLRGLVGDYTELIEPDSLQEARLCAIAFHDERTGLIGEPMPSKKLDEMMKKEKDYQFVTDYYLYCNWRVWATYQHNKELAEKYQSICDTIDDYVFDNWDEEMIRYFVQKTD